MKRSRRICLITLGLFGIAGVIGFGLIIERRMAIKRADGAMVEKVEKALAGALAADAELTQRLGSFQRLEGSGHKRANHMWMLIARIELSRTAVFDRGTLGLGVMIACSEDRDLDKKPIRSINWQEDPHRGRMSGGDYLAVTVGLDYGRTAPTWTITGVSLSGDCRTVSLGGMNRVEVWDRASQTKRRDIEGRFGPVNHLTQAGGSSRLLVDCDQSLKIVDGSTGDFVRSYPFLGTRMQPLAGISGDGRTVVQSAYDASGTGTTPQMALVHDPDSPGSSSRLINGSPAQPAQKLVLSPDGRHALLVLRNQDGVQCWDLKTKSQAWTKDDPVNVARFSSPGYGAVFTPVTGRLCVGFTRGFDGSVEVWNPQTGDLEKALEVPPKAIWEAWKNGNIGDIMTAVSADEQLLALALGNGRVLVWHLPSGKFTGLITNTDWVAEGPLSKVDGGTMLVPTRTGIGAERTISSERLAAIGFDESNRLVGVSHNRSASWVWLSHPEN